MLCLIILAWFHDECHADGKTLYIHICFVDLEKVFSRIQSVGAYDKGERNTTNFGWISDESV